MSERLLDKLYIGIDLKEESAMLSYFHPGMERPATVSFVAGSRKITTIINNIRLYNIVSPRTSSTKR